MRLKYEIGQAVCTRASDVFQPYLIRKYGHDALVFNAVKKDCLDDYPFIVQYQGIVKAQRSRFHMCDSCLDPALLDFAVSCLYPSSFGISLGLDWEWFVANLTHFSS